MPAQSLPSTKPSSTLVRIPKPYSHPISLPRVLRVRRFRVGKPITNGTSLGSPPFGIGKTSIGERVKASQTAHVANDTRRRWPSSLTKSTQLAIKKGKQTNRNASNQKKDEDSRRIQTAPLSDFSAGRGWRKIPITLIFPAQRGFECNRLVS